MAAPAQGQPASPDLELQGRDGQVRDNGELPAPGGEKRAVSPIEFFETASDEQIKERFVSEAREIQAEYQRSLHDYCILSLYAPTDTIDADTTNKIYRSLRVENSDGVKDVLLILVSPGGRIEPAYQISKICKTYSKGIFSVVVPRAAKSAATLLAIGADKIHIGMLGELGPIDPQLNNLPALGVRSALETIASICEKYPKSADAFARYMTSRVTIEHIGYCDRVAESAVQYAEKLLVKKERLKPQAGKIARQLVYEYKDHNFVIDAEEAREQLGTDWVVTDSPELGFGERYLNMILKYELLLRIIRSKEIRVVGAFDKAVEISDSDVDSF